MFHSETVWPAFVQAGCTMAENSSENRPNPRPGLPMVTETQRPRPSLTRTTSTATFVSQLLVERSRPAPPWPRRNLAVEGALGAYSAGAQRGIRRMPLGYRKSMFV